MTSYLPSFSLLPVLLFSGCDLFTDAATRLAHDIKAATRNLNANGDTFTLYHEVPSKRGECEGPYTVQLDEVGALIFWCKDSNGEVIASPGTSSHRQFVDIPRTYYLDKMAGETLVLELERRGDRAVIVDVR